MGISVELMLRIGNPGQIQDLYDAIASFRPRQLLMCLSASRSCQLIVRTWFSADPGFGNERNARSAIRRISSSGRSRSSRPSNAMRPPTMRPGAGSRPRTDMTVSVFPHPHSPTIPSDRPACSSKEHAPPHGRPRLEEETTREISYRENHGTGSSVKADHRSRRSVDAATGRQSHLATSSRYDAVTFVRYNQRRRNRS